MYIRHCTGFRKQKPNEPSIDHVSDRSKTLQRKSFARSKGCMVLSTAGRRSGRRTRRIARKTHQLYTYDSLLTSSMSGLMSLMVSKGLPLPLLSLLSFSSSTPPSPAGSALAPAAPTEEDEDEDGPKMYGRSSSAILAVEKSKETTRRRTIKTRIKIGIYIGRRMPPLWAPGWAGV